MTTTTKTILTFSAGVFVGVVLVAALSHRATVTFVENIASYYRYEQQHEAAQAIKNKDYFTAINHYKNLIDASSQNPESTFQEAKNNWGLLFPFAAEIIRSITSNSDPTGLGKTRDNGINHGMLAYALENYGMLEQANSEWKQASIMLEQTDMSKLKQLIENIIITQQKY